jgi:tetratricopeptide (TPR) repeat protein
VILDSKALAPGLDRGFDFYDNFPEQSKTKSRWGRVERRGMDVVQHAKAWLTAHPSGPHFVWVHLYDPHDPYEPPPPYAATYRDRLYDGEIAYADSALGNFLDYLKAHNWYQNAVIVVVGDHGEGLGEHREQTHGIFLYDSTIHVPLIFKLPARLSAARVVDAHVRTIDILPTVLDLVGVNERPQLSGESLKGFFSGQAASRVALGETDYPLRFGWASLRSVRTEAFKFIEAPRPELYDLRSDPGELHNSYADGNADIGRLRALLAELPSKSPAPRQGSSATESTSTSEASPLPDPKDKIEEQNLLHAALVASENDQPADARKALEKVLEMDEKSPVALRQLGELELEAGDYAQASSHLKAANQLRPGDAAVAYHLGQSLFKVGDLAGAREALESSLKTAPGQIPARILLGNVYLQLKDKDAAKDQFEAVLLSEPNNAEAKGGIAKINATQK